MNGLKLMFFHYVSSTGEFHRVFSSATNNILRVESRLRAHRWNVHSEECYEHPKAHSWVNELVNYFNSLSADKR